MVQLTQSQKRALLSVPLVLVFVWVARWGFAGSGAGWPALAPTITYPGRGSGSGSAGRRHGRSLILYVYAETENARPNIEFFLRHAIHDAADFIFVINGALDGVGATDVVDYIPDLGNVRVVRRDNSCFDMGAVAEVLLGETAFADLDRGGMKVEGLPGVRLRGEKEGERKMDRGVDERGGGQKRGFDSGNREKEGKRKMDRGVDERGGGQKRGFDSGNREKEGERKMDRGVDERGGGQKRGFDSGNREKEGGGGGGSIKRAGKPLWKRYNRFLTLNASVRGPFMPAWTRECWSDMYWGMLSDNVKLVGTTMNCYLIHHLQSMLLATDDIGMSVLLEPSETQVAALREMLKATPDIWPGRMREPGIAHCPQDKGAAVASEIYITPLIRAAGFNISLSMSAYTGIPDYEAQCSAHPEHFGNLAKGGDLLWPGSYFGMDVHPYETGFVKTSRGIGEQTLAKMTEWMDGREYSSFEYCKAKGKH